MDSATQNPREEEENRIHDFFFLHDTCRRFWHMQGNQNNNFQSNPPKQSSSQLPSRGVNRITQAELWKAS